ncbi:MAG: acetolactate decarboxylase [Dehalococcoidia bacterium]|nr:MAG: acetolactate decarboxylase [Dehalococcoidia bacterium]
MFARRKFGIVAAVTLLCLAFVISSGCSTDKTSPDYAGNPVAGRETLAQISTIDAVLSGVYDGIMSYETLKGYGDFGIGTFKALDGEMVAFDGGFYQIKANGKAYPVSGDMETPFASVTFFDTDGEYELSEGIDFAGLQKFMDATLPTENTFYAIRIDGTFSYMKTRSVPAQEKPYPPLVEVTKNQPVFEFGNIAGTVAGFRCPPFAVGVNMPGYHLHFLTDSRDAGGHILDFKVQQAVVSIDRTPDFFMVLPDSQSDFYKIDLTPNKQEELEQAEK